MGYDDPFVFGVAAGVKSLASRSLILSRTLPIGSNTTQAASYISGYKGLADGFTNLVMHGEQFNIMTAEEISTLLTNKNITGNVRLWVCEGGADMGKIMEVAKMKNIKIQASPYKIQVSRNNYKMLGSDTNLFELFDGTVK